MTKARYIGADGDDNQIVHMAGVTFVKGQWADVDDKHEQFDRLKANPTFEVKGDDAHPEPQMDEVAEVERIKAELRSRGVAVRGNPSLDTLRNKLAAVVDSDEPAPEPEPPVVGG